MKIQCSKVDPPLGGLIVAEYVKISVKSTVDVSWGEETVVENIHCRSSQDVARAVVKLLSPQLYGSTAVEVTEVDHWLTFSLGSLTINELPNALAIINNTLAPSTFLVGKNISIADFAVFAALYVNKSWQNMVDNKSAPSHILRWYKFMNSQEAVQNVLSSLPADVKANLTEVKIKSKAPSGNAPVSASNRQQEGKFIDLPGAEIGKVVVRFPPEASGYLHIGHAKAALLNQYYQQTFKGKLVMRFDDTNPAKEDVHFEKVILEDIATMEIKPDRLTHTSEYFDLMIEYCEKLLREGKAYVDDTEAELMKTQREQKIESVNRNNTAEMNFSLWEEMKKGTELGQKYCVRAKIDMQSPNGCLRDPTIYRCKNETHPRTGDKYKVYPTYDFACPIVDSIEDVTHVLRTMEYHDRDPQFYWFIEALGLRKPYIWEYSRLSMTNTVLSKRKLTWFVNEGLVDGWDDPRMPTVRGVLRRGMTVQGLKEFIIAQGSSRSVVFMEWDKIWAFNKKVIDPIAPRYTALEYEEPIPVFVNNVKEECTSVPKHPKNIDVGMKDVWVAPKILIDRVDAELLKEGENTTFINWGNLLIKKINRMNGKIISINAEPNLENKDYKKTLKLTWLAEVGNVPFTPTRCVYFDHIISKPVLSKDEDFKQFIGHETRKEVPMIGDPELRKLKQGDIIQLQRRGFFKVDVPYQAADLHTCREQPMVLFSIPDGHVKENPLGKTVNNANSDQAYNQKIDDKKHARNINTLSSEANDKIIKQGDVVRKLKEKQAVKSEIDAAVKILLSLKAEYKNITNTDWKPGCVPCESVCDNASSCKTELNAKIVAQGEKVRQLKAQKSDKAVLDSEVKILLALKADYKSLAGQDWKPDTAQVSPFTPVHAVNVSVGTLLQKIAAQGDKVRELKGIKADKAVVDSEVKTLLALKAEYKSLTGVDWKLDTAQVALSELEQGIDTSVDENTLLLKIAAQGEKIRELKGKKSDKATIDNEVKQLLSLKSEFKSVTGIDWKPTMKPAVISPSSLTTTINQALDENQILSQIAAQGDKVRMLKDGKADKSIIGQEVNVLLQLKADYKQLSGKEWKPITKKEEGGDSDLKTKKANKEKSQSGNKNMKPKVTKPDGQFKEKVVKQKAAVKEKQTVAAEDNSVKKQTRLGLEAKKEENLSDWYSQVITKGEMIEYYDVSGCYIFRPWSFSIWEAIRDWFDAEIKKLGVQNCYFPIFVSKSVLEKEKTHIADFAPEVAWVTKSGDSDMAEPIAVRPTSETVMYPAYAKWIQSYRDLPIKLNQWNNVVRWEFKHPQPFLRTREFLWQEGHTAYALKEEADEEVKQILDLYARIYTDLLAIPVVKGRKTEKEKFAGGDYTLTVEAFVSASGRAIQGATSHHLGQNFSKMFDITYEDPETQEKKFVYQNSWGITTRTIGVMVMVHADNQGLVLPPKVATIQVVLVPCGITATLSEQARKNLQSSCDELELQLKTGGIRVKGDYRSNYSPGWKFNHWELKGVPIRVELGPKDVENLQIVAVRRDTGAKIIIPRSTVVEKLKELLEEIQRDLLKKSTEDLTAHTVLLKHWEDFSSNLDKKNIILAPFCGDVGCENKIKEDSTRDDTEPAEQGAPAMGAKSLCIPIEQPARIEDSDKCIHPDCSRKPQFYTLFGRSY